MRPRSRRRLWVVVVVVGVACAENTYLVLQRDTDIFGTASTFANESNLIPLDVTFSAWVRCRAQERVVFMSDGNYMFSPYMFTEDTITALAIDNQIFRAGASANVTTGWHHFVSVVDRQKQHLHYFFDGQEVGEAVDLNGEWGDGESFGPDGTADGLVFGRFARWSDEGTHLERVWPWAGVYGYMDEISLWSKALSAEEIAEVYGNGLNASQSRVARDSLVICYDMEEEEGRRVVKNQGSAGSAFDAILGAYITRVSPDYVEAWMEETDDGCNEIVATTLPIRVNPAWKTGNTAPTCDSQAVDVVEDNEVTFYPYGYDADGDWLEYSITTLPEHGSLWEVDNARPDRRVKIEETPYAPVFAHFMFAYEPALESQVWIGMRASDGLADSAEAKIVVSLITVNNKPTTARGTTTVETLEDTMLAFDVGAHDEDSKFLTTLVDTLPSSGVLYAVYEDGTAHLVDSTFESWSSTRPINQYAISVHKVSSFWESPENDEYEYPYWHPFMATGPQSVDVYGDSRLAWSPRTRNAGAGVYEGGDNLLSFGPWDPRTTWETEGYSEFIELDFETRVYVQHVYVGMPRGMGSVVSLKAWDNITASYMEVYSGDADPDYERYMQLTRQYSVFDPYPVCTTAFKANRVRIELDSVTVADWNEIDYVELVGTESKQSAIFRVDDGYAHFVYVPNQDFAGSDEFTYRVCDCGSTRCSETATVTIDVIGVNDAPQVPSERQRVEVGCDVAGSVGSFALRASDVDANETLAYVLTSPATGGFGGGSTDDDDAGFSLLTVDAASGVGGAVILEFPYALPSNVAWYELKNSDATWANFSYTVFDHAGARAASNGTVTITCRKNECSPGSYYDGTECAPCPPGRFADDVGVRSACELCPKDEFSSGWGATLCVACGLEEYSTADRGATECTCLPGARKDGQGRCSLCTPGKYSDVVDAENCTDCLPGNYPTDSANDTDGSGVTFGAEACVKCPRDTFSESPETALCAPCPLLRASEPGSTACSECVQFYYLSRSEEECLLCDTHVTCDPGTTLATWNLDEGYWRADPSTTQIYQCPATSSCIGGAGATGDDDSICGDNFVGRLCSLCGPTYHLSGTRCRRCKESSTHFVYTFVAISTVALVALLLFFSGKPAFMVDLAKAVSESQRKRRMHSQRLQRDVLERRLLVHPERSSVALIDGDVSPVAKSVRHKKNASFSGGGGGGGGAPPIADSSNDNTAAAAAEGPPRAATSVEAGPADRKTEEEGEEDKQAQQQQQQERNKRKSRRLMKKLSSLRSMGGTTTTTTRPFSSLRSIESGKQRKLENAQNSVTFMRLYAMLSVKWKIVISAFQILASNSTSFLIKWPPVVSFLLGFLSILNVDILFIPQFACLRRINHYNQLLAATGLPLALIAVIAFFIIVPLDTLAKAKKCCYEQQHSKVALAVIVLFFAYSSASQTIALTFVCQHFEEANESYLRTDLSIRCSGLTYQLWFAYAVAMMFVWPLGIPLLFFCLCWNRKARIDPVRMTKKHVDVSLATKTEAVNRAVAQRQFDPDIHDIKALWMPYEPEFWYWESVISGQRMLLTFVASLVKPGTPVQPIFCLCVAIFFLRIQSFYNPYCHDQDDVLAEALAWMLIFFYVQALMFMLGYVSGLTMDVLLCVSIGIAVLGSAFLLVTDIQREIRFLTLFRKWVDSTLKTRRERRPSNRRDNAACYVVAAQRATREIKEYFGDDAAASPAGSKVAADDADDADDAGDAGAEEEEEEDLAVVPVPSLSRRDHRDSVELERIAESASDTDDDDVLDPPSFLVSSERRAVAPAVAIDYSDSDAFASLTCGVKSAWSSPVVADDADDSRNLPICGTVSGYWT